MHDFTPFQAISNVLSLRLGHLVTQYFIVRLGSHFSR